MSELDKYRRYPGAPAYADVPLTGQGLSIGLKSDAPGCAPSPRNQVICLPAPYGPERAFNQAHPEGQVVGPRPTCDEDCGIAENGLRIFSQWGDLDANDMIRPETPDMNAFQFLRTPPAPIDDQGNARSALWMVDVWGWERARRVEAGGAALPPLSDDLYDLNIEQGTQMSRLKVRISMHGSSGGSTRIIDLAEGIRFAIEACQVTVDILYPKPGTPQVAGQSELVLGGGGGLVLDSAIGGYISETTSTPGNQLTTNTITVRVPAGDDDVPIFVPPGARGVTLWQSGDGSVMTPQWRLLRQARGSAGYPGPSVGEIGFLGSGAPRDRQSVSRPGNAGMLTSGPADQSDDRILTAVWELEI